MFTETVVVKEGGPGRTRITHSTFAGNTGGRGTLVGYIDVVQPGRFEVRNSILAGRRGTDLPSESRLDLAEHRWRLQSGARRQLCVHRRRLAVERRSAARALAEQRRPTSTHAPLEGSPASDAGACTDIQSNTMAADQRGVTRPQGPGCDVGAYERQLGPRGVFTGFFAPVASPPAVNCVKAGQAIPVKFSLNGDSA